MLTERKALLVGIGAALVVVVAGAVIFWRPLAALFAPRDVTALARSCSEAAQKRSADALRLCADAAASDQLKETNKTLYLNSIFNLGFANMSQGIDALKVLKKDEPGYFEQAEAAYKRYLAESGSAERPQTLELLAYLYFYYLDKPDDALQALERLVALGSFQSSPPSRRVAVYNLLGRTYHFLGRFPEAKSAFQKALAVNEVSADTMYYVHGNLALTLAREGKRAEALKELSAAKRLGQNSFDGCFEAIIYYTLEQYDDTIRIANKAKEQDVPWCSYVLGLVYVARGQNAEAKKELSAFVTWADDFIERYKEAPLALDIDADVPARSIYFREAVRRAHQKLGQL